MINRRGIYTLFRKEMRRVVDVWKQTIIAPVITNLLFLVIFVKCKGMEEAVDLFNTAISETLHDGNCLILEKRSEINYE